MRGLVQILAVGSILLILLRAPDWTNLSYFCRPAMLSTCTVIFAQRFT
jgi:hypothetical protein